MLSFERINYIPVSMSLKAVREALKEGSKVKAVVTGRQLKGVPSPEAPMLDGIEFVNFDGVWVDSPLVTGKGMDGGYLAQKIQGDTVYASLSGYCQGLPCHALPYKLKEGNSLTDEDIEYYNYKVIEYQEEQTIADLYINAWKYKYSRKTDTFRPLSEDEAIANLGKVMIAKNVTRIGGHPQDRLADYGRLILFLLSKVKLTAAEKEALGSLLDYLPTAEDIKGVAAREAEIQEVVANNKAHMRALLGLEDDGDGQGGTVWHR